MTSERLAAVTNVDPRDLCPPGNTERQTGHHWKIETPRGPTSKGTCKRCGDARTFPNSTDVDHRPSRSRYTVSLKRLLDMSPYKGLDNAIMNYEGFSGFDPSTGEEI